MLIAGMCAGRISRSPIALAAYEHEYHHEKLEMSGNFLAELAKHAALLMSGVFQASAWAAPDALSGPVNLISCGSS